MTENEHINYSDEFILVVDDEESIREITVEMLTKLGMRAEAVESGDKALELLKEKSYTFLLSDIKMPGMDGLELISGVKGEHPEVCAIAMTGYSKEYSYVDVVNSGATDFINKPFRVEELVAKIRRAIIERNIRQELNRLSITDSLTDLYNQRHFYDCLRKEMLRANRQHSGLAVILIDLDEFKSYNDRYGHLAGDKVLQQVGKAINKNVRQGVDSGFRYGGDEFAVLLIDATEESAKMMSERIVNSIKAECDISASAGYAVLSEDVDMEPFIDKADRQLYQQKAAKNNV
ncbi:MAG: diguanylate cyclase [Desulfatiglandaceae bacterium]